MRRLPGGLQGLACFFLPAFLLAGCVSPFTGYPTDFRNTSDILAADKTFLGADVRDKGAAQSDTARGGLTQQQYRDTVVYRRLEVIDSYYYGFETALTGVYNGAEVGADLTTLALNGLGATTGTSQTKAALAAASAGVVGAKNAVNTDIFYQKTLPALIAQMRADRQKVLATIEKGISGPYASYSLDAALNDVNAYYLAGTLPGAITEITSNAGATKAAADATINNLRTITYAKPSITGQRILNWIFPGGDMTKKPDSTNVGKLTTWMQGYTVDPRLAMLPWVALTQPGDQTLEADRVQAIKDLNIP